MLSETKSSFLFLVGFSYWELGVQEAGRRKKLERFALGPLKRKKNPSSKKCDTKKGRLIKGGACITIEYFKAGERWNGRKSFPCGSWNMWPA